MNTRYPFEYVTIRVVPRVERAEFVNAGVVVYCQALEYLEAGVEVDPVRVRALDPEADVAAIAAAVTTYVELCTADGDDPAAEMSRGERFRWLAAPRSTIVQPGPVHPGLTTDPAADLARLMDELVR